MIKTSKIPNVDLMTLSEIEEKGLTHLLVNKSKLKRQAGRPRKLPDRQYQFNLSYWYGLIAADYHQLSRHQRVRVALECWKTLIARMKTLPADPQESRLNAEEAMRMLGKLEKAQANDEEGERTASRLTDTAPQAALSLIGEALPPVKPDALEDASNLNDEKAAE